MDNTFYNLKNFNTFYNMQKIKNTLNFMESTYVYTTNQLKNILFLLQGRNENIYDAEYIHISLNLDDGEILTPKQNKEISNIYDVLQMALDEKKYKIQNEMIDACIKAIKNIL